jgi:dolichol-phosphate mannosyltransferase
MLAISSLGYDLVLASVYAQGGGFDKTSFFRRLVSSVANLVFRFLFKLKILTLSSFYRVYHVSLLRKIKEKNTPIIAEKGFICMLEILVKAVECDANVIEVPMILHSQKRVGKSKLKFLKTMLAYVRFLMKRS